MKKRLSAMVLAFVVALSMIPGVFAAGDCTGGPLQVSKAVGEGLVAGQSAAALQPIPQDAEATLGLFRHQPLIIMHTNAGGVITPVFQLLQSI